MTGDAQTGPEGGERRRRRRRATSPQGPPVEQGPPVQQGPPVGLAQSESTPQRPVPGPAPRPADASAHEAAPKPGPQRGRSPRRRRAPRDAGDHGLRDIVGAGPSQLGVSGALRGRDVNRPTEADIAEAEQDLVIVRRNWQPPDHR